MQLYPGETDRRRKMIRGIYTATSGMLVNQAENEIVANNLANVSTPGFRKDVAVYRAHPEQQIHRINDFKERLNHLSIDFRPPVGMIGTGAVVDNIYTSSQPGPLVFTDNKTDVAIIGDGYVAVETEQGIMYTRSGNFRVGSDGYLVTQDGHYVLAQEEPVPETPGNVVISADGEPMPGLTRMPLSEMGDIDINDSGQVIVDDEPAFRLAVVRFEDRNMMHKVGRSLYTNREGLAGDAVNAADTMVKQGHLEQSNVSSVEEMVKLINCFRAYEINQKCITSQDQTLDKAVNTVPRAS